MQIVIFDKIDDCFFDIVDCESPASPLFAVPVISAGIRPK